MTGKTVVITGGTSGIGQVAAEALAGMGARIVLIARDPARGETTMTRLRAKGPGAAHAIHYADLSRLAEMKRVGREIAAAEPRVDILINNAGAGALFSRREVTEDGLELTFATNHMAYFVLTHLLRDKLVASAPARVISTSSNAHQSAKLNFDDLQLEKGFSGVRAYGQSKLCNILFTRELARRLEGTGVTANCLHPGFVATRIGDQAPGFGSWVIGFLKNFAISPEKGADTIIYLASSDEPAKVTGAYFYKRRESTPTREARDGESGHRLWRETAKLAGLAD